MSWGACPRSRWSYNEAWNQSVVLVVLGNVNASFRTARTDCMYKLVDYADKQRIENAINFSLSSNITQKSRLRENLSEKKCTIYLRALQWEGVCVYVRGIWVVIIPTHASPLPKKPVLKRLTFLFSFSTSSLLQKLLVNLPIFGFLVSRYDLTS